MTTNLLEPRKALNKAFLKIKPNRSNIEQFKTNLIAILDNSGTESEEFHKNLVIEFLKKTYYDPNHFVNTKGRNDLVIHNGKEAKTNVGVIIEVKSPSNKTEMIATENLNQKAMQELVLYYLRERITHKNTELKNMVVTNIYEWFVFDAQLFNNLFAENKTLVKQFIDFEEGRASGKTTDYFYKEIAKPFLEKIKSEITFAYFDIRQYEKPLRNDDKEDDKMLIALFKLLSPEHLLKLSFANDSNSLDKNFYNELLHIIGLTEIKDGGKKLIKRHEKGNRNDGSLLENAILQLESEDKLNYFNNLEQYGENSDEQLFAIGLELTITWVNRILFLKLLEAQLITYHNGDKSYAFLNSDLIKDYDNLNSLFFKVLAKKPIERIDRIAKLFSKVPYLNSSLFETTNLERIGLSIAQLEDKIPLPLLANTVIKDANGKKEIGSKDALDYFFSFLNAYDFASEGSEDIQEDNKTLINASVLGLIFEKINGYKDGSFFTPSFITMYMCKETIRRAVIEKFRASLTPSPLTPKGGTVGGEKGVEKTAEKIGVVGGEKDSAVKKSDGNKGTVAAEFAGREIKTFEDVYNSITDKKAANAIINSLKICDPAVGSGHFLVSALNEIIVIKHELGILMDKNGKTIHNDYDIEIVNDELIVTDSNGVPFQYKLNNKESQRIQETLFHEKQTIIENCLFGVDINPNSVKICRLRLWIELLKNAYYHDAVPQSSPSPSKGGEPARALETLPNIDINIKCGNSLISRFGLDADIKKALKSSKWNIDMYKIAVKTYQNAESKEQKREMEALIENIKGDFKTEINTNDPKKIKLEKRKGELFNYTQQVGLFERSKKEQTEWNKTVNVLAADIKTLETEIEDIKSNKIYENAFEWRFEFPEVLNDDGDFVGFDVVIGNPPYVQLQSMKEMSMQYQKLNFSTYTSMGDLYALFYEKGNQILKNDGILCFITGSAWMRANYGSPLRDYLISKTKIIELIDFSDCEIFENATVLTNILMFEKSEIHKIIKAIRFTRKDQDKLPFMKEIFDKEYIEIDGFPASSWIISDNASFNIKTKVESQGIKLIYRNIKINRGILTGLNEAFIINTKTKEDLILKDPNSSNIIKPLLRGRDIKKYHYDYQDLWLINSHNGTKEKGIKPINIEEYPVIKNYLDVNYSKLEKRTDKGNTPYNLRNCAYLEEFEKQKIIYSELTKFLYFSFDTENKYVDKTAFILTGFDLEYLICFLNSSLFKYCFAHNFSEIQGNTRVLSKITFEQIPVKIPNKTDQQPFIDKVNEILTLKKANPQADTLVLEAAIDTMVYELYGLNDDEIKIVENS